MPAPDQWSTSNFGDDEQSLDSDNLSTTGAQLRAVVSGFVDVKELETTKKIPLEILEEARLWEQHFPTLSVTGKQMKREKEPVSVNHHSPTERLAVARRVVIGNLIADVQKLIQNEIGPVLPPIVTTNVQRSQSMPVSKVTKVDLPRLQEKK